MRVSPCSCIAVCGEVAEPMNVTVIVVGLGVLLVLGVLIGAAEGRAQSQAWRKIADARHANWADRQRQAADQQARDEDYAQLVRMAESCNCRVCRLLRG
jgi:hypothetical protein